MSVKIEYGLPIPVWNNIIEASDTCTALSQTCLFFSRHIATNFPEKIIPRRFVEMLPAGPNFPVAAQKAALRFFRFLHFAYPELAKRVDSIVPSQVERFGASHGWNGVECSLDGLLSEEDFKEVMSLTDTNVRKGLLPRMHVNGLSMPFHESVAGLATQLGLSEGVSQLWLSIAPESEEKIFSAIKRGASDVELITLLHESKKCGYSPSVRLLIDAIGNDCSLEVVVTLCALGGLGLTDRQLLGIKIAKFQGGIKVPLILYENDENSIEEWNSLVEQRYAYIEQCKKNMLSEDAQGISWLTQQLEQFTLRDPFKGKSHMGNPIFWEEKPTMNHVLHLIKDGASFRVVFYRLFKGGIKLTVSQILELMTTYQLRENQKISELNLCEYSSESDYNNSDKIYFDF